MHGAATYNLYLNSSRKTAFLQTRPVSGRDSAGGRASEEVLRKVQRQGRVPGCVVSAETQLLVQFGLPEGGNWCAEVILLWQRPFSLFDEGGICPTDTWAAGAAPSLDSPVLVVL